MNIKFHRANSTCRTCDHERASWTYVITSGFRLYAEHSAKRDRPGEPTFWWAWRAALQNERLHRRRTFGQLVNGLLEKHGGPKRVGSVYWDVLAFLGTLEQGHPLFAEVASLRAERNWCL